MNDLQYIHFNYMYSASPKRTLNPCLVEWMVLHPLEPYYREAFDKAIVD